MSDPFFFLLQRTCLRSVGRLARDMSQEASAGDA